MYDIHSSAKKKKKKNTSPTRYSIGATRDAVGIEEAESDRATAWPKKQNWTSEMDYIIWIDSRRGDGSRLTCFVISPVPSTSKSSIDSNWSSMLGGAIQLLLRPNLLGEH